MPDSRPLFGVRPAAFTLRPLARNLLLKRIGSGPVFGLLGDPSRAGDNASCAQVSVDQLELHRKQGLATAGAAADERRTASWEPAARDLVQPLDA